MKKIVLFAVTVLTLGGLLQAQDQSNFTQFYINPFLYNPSYAGIDGQSAMSLLYKKQWMSIEGAPTIGNFSIHTPVNPEMSTGLSITNDKRGIFNNTSLLGTYAYHLKLKKAHSFFRFGLSLGGTWNGVDQQMIESFNDPLLGKVLDNSASVAGNAGISFQSNFLQIGVSMPTLFSPAYISDRNFAIKEIRPFESLILNVSNRFHFGNNKHIFEPHLIYRLNGAAPSQYEGAGIFHLSHLIWVGGSYKQDFGFSGLAGIKLKNILAIGGSYTFQNSGINELNSPSFEISINYLLGKHKRGSPVYSFVNTGKEKKVLHPSASHAIAAKHNQTSSQPTKQPAQKKNPVKPPVKSQPVVAKKDPPVTKPAPVVAEPEKPVAKKVEPKPEHLSMVTPAVTPIPEGHHEHEQEQLKRLEVHAEDPHEHHDGSIEHPHAERHEFVKRGGHEKELPVSDYVIGGVFGKEENAKHFSQGLDKLGFDTHYGHLTAKNLWYVYIIQTENLDEARAARDKARKTKLLRDAWLLTVHH